MNADMAIGAVLETGIQQIMLCRLQHDTVCLTPESGLAVVTFEAKRVSVGAAQQLTVHGAVRHMAGLAAVYARCPVFKHKWAAFILMALNAGLFVTGCLIDHARALAGPPGCREGPVGVVAIRALYGAFVHPMFGWHLKLGALRGVALVTEFLLLGGGQQIFRRMRFP